MTIWVPELAGNRPRYQALADAIAADLESGKLNPGDRLPAHRDLAWRLGLTVGTITRGYQEAARRGLLVGEVGRGSFLRGPASRPSATPIVPSSDSGAVNMYVATPPRVASHSNFDAALLEVAQDPDRLALLDYAPPGGTPEQRRMGASWLARCGVGVSPSQVVLAAGGHGALVACLAGVARAGDDVLVEPLTYPTIQPLARMLGLKLHALQMDDDGIVVGSVGRACSHGNAKFLYLVPTLHNPLSVTLPEERRHAIVEIARRHDLTIIEDDVFRLVANEQQPPALFSLAPERCYYISSLSKSVAPGLRCGFLATPVGMADAIARQQMVAGARTTSLAIEVARYWAASGTMDGVLKDIRMELAERQAMVSTIFAGVDIQTAPGSLFFWLPLPRKWRAVEFASAAEARGIRVTPGMAFATGGFRSEADHAVRVCIGAVRTRGALADGLAQIRRLMEESPEDNFRAIA